MDREWIQDDVKQPFSTPEPCVSGSRNALIHLRLFSRAVPDDSVAAGCVNMSKILHFNWRTGGQASRCSLGDEPRGSSGMIWPHWVAQLSNLPAVWYRGNDNRRLRPYRRQSPLVSCMYSSSNGIQEIRSVIADTVKPRQ